MAPPRDDASDPLSRVHQIARENMARVGYTPAERWPAKPDWHPSPSLTKLVDENLARVKYTEETHNKRASPQVRSREDSVQGYDTAPQLSSNDELSNGDTEDTALFVEAIERYPTRAFPTWYTDIKDTNLYMTQLLKKRPQSLTALESLKNCIGRCEIASKKPSMLYQELRNHIHKAEFLDVNKYIVKRSRILHPDNGLPRIFKEEATFPSDLQADSFQLYTRWMKEEFSQDILRGIKTIKGKDRNGDQLDPDYRKNHPANARFHGQGDLVNGQWWPTQLCTLRDGAHGVSQGGISGDVKEGAYSIVLSASSYHDKDDGNLIEYSGTTGKEKDSRITDATQSMITAYYKKKQVRVIRSSKLNNAYRPEVGFRYDGLYEITGYNCVDEKLQKYRFSLQRCSGQDPIRCVNNGSERPTFFEREEYAKLKEKLW